MSSNEPVAIQFSDLRGFSSYTAQHGDEKDFKIARHFVDLVGASVEQHGGRIRIEGGTGGGTRVVLQISSEEDRGHPHTHRR